MYALGQQTITAVIIFLNSTSKFYVQNTGTRVLDVELLWFNGLGSESGLEKPGNRGDRSPGPHKGQFLEGTGGTGYVKLDPFQEIARQIR